ncbi:cysteine--tRNA ligase, mitochondrial [Episyrphus balteatus]|uniref:cysteine--tRNA ligase, mitochondrial n=1 Tax=Episyrphus balteatus TaxID=286459 RepID=UPI002484D7FE|nr:cysteine--tRNA ligase, mitochondrial [Episyrphus balteatus]
MLHLRTNHGLSLKQLCKYSHQWHKPAGYETGIQVYNTITRSNVPLVLQNEHIATWYTCGPTVYDSSHLGHASCYVKLDIIQRILRNHFKINLVTAMNITDIDDKIIQRSQESGKSCQDLAKSYELEFWNDMDRLGVAEPNVKIRVTENIPQIVAFIDKIVQDKSAYIGRDQSIYFDVSSHSGYGKLQKLNLEQVSHETKESTVDFALWKAKKEPNEPSWQSPWGDGRPGWHIECSALASMIFGKSIDIHAGGLDLKFPHHENEEAQCCVFHKTPQWVNYWLHTGHLSVVGQSEKMSKSLKNTIGIDELLKTYSSNDFRMACMLSNYRSSVEYGDSMMNTAQGTLKRFSEFNSNVDAYLEGKKRSASIDSNQILELLSQSKVLLNQHLKDDFNTARCVGVLIELASTVSKSINSTAEQVDIFASNLDTVAAVRNFINSNLQMFGFEMMKTVKKSDKNLDLSLLLEDLVKTRNEMRQRAMESKNKEMFKVCDELRNCLQRNGIQLKDHSQGSTWNYIK